MFMSLVSTIIELLPMARKIKSDEMDLYTTITNTITNDNSNTAISSVLLEKISQHVDNHTIICSDYIRYRDEDRQETITVNTENFGTHQTLYHKNIYYILPG